MFWLDGSHYAGRWRRENVLLDYDTEPGFDDATLTVTMILPAGTCMTSLTDYNSGDIIGERLTAGKVMPKVVISAGG